MDGICNTHVEINAKKLSVENLIGRDHLGDISLRIRVTMLGCELNTFQMYNLWIGYIYNESYGNMGTDVN